MGVALAPLMTSIYKTAAFFFDKVLLKLPSARECILNLAVWVRKKKYLLTLLVPVVR